VPSDKEEPKMSTNTILIPAELVALVRGGAYSDLQGSLDEASALTEGPGRESEATRVLVDGCLARVVAARALLGALGWPGPDEPFALDLDLGEHRGALRGALQTRLEADEGHLESLARVGEDCARERAAGDVGAVRALLAELGDES
jgi:hypothetical protein